MDLTGYTDQQLTELRQELDAETTRRRVLNSIPAEVEALSLQYLAAKGITTGGAWVQPAGAVDAYPVGWVCTHNGQAWISTVPANVFEPGTTGWDAYVEVSE